MSRVAQPPALAVFLSQDGASQAHPSGWRADPTLM